MRSFVRFRAFAGGINGRMFQQQDRVINEPVGALSEQAALPFPCFDIVDRVRAQPISVELPPVSLRPPQNHALVE